ncbi:MAG: hypothetical protein BYD32DRAFT_429454 [Podila humilis]|nr:MAG: hypothetical protein BYD32DRAFT_429454 [Podila humilis]
MATSRTIVVFLAPLLLSSSLPFSLSLPLSISLFLSLVQSLSFSCPILLSSLSRIRFSTFIVLLFVVAFLTTPFACRVVVALSLTLAQGDNHLNPHKKTKHH